MFYKSPFPKTIKMTEMKKNNRNFILFAILLLFNACSDGWDSESQELFHQSCMEDALTWAPNEGKAREYCDCVLERTMTKYPKMSDALTHIDSVITDPKIRGCKTEIIR